MTGKTNTIPESAFPQVVRIEGPTHNPFTGKDIPVGKVDIQIDRGLSVRDYFAAKAMQALIHGQVHVQVQTKQAQTTETAYEWADAMLKARVK